MQVVKRYLKLFIVWVLRRVHDFLEGCVDWFYNDYEPWSDDVIVDLIGIERGED